MSRGRSLAVLCAAALAVASACGRDEAPRFAAPAEERAALLLEPPQLALGEVAELVLAVVTHPGARIASDPLPAPPPGLYVIERAPQQVEREAARWVHRTRMRIRAVAVGRFELPGGVVRGETAEGTALEIPYQPLTLEVASSLGDEALRRTPWGVRRLPAPGAGRAAAALAFGAGAATVLGGVGVLLLARRRRAERAARPPAPSGPPPAPPWQLAQAALDDAAARLAADPRAALDAGARALRGYVAARYGADAPARSVEELAAMSPPFALTTRWQAFVALLAALDAQRFRPPGRVPPGAPSAPELLESARGFVADTTPQQGLR